MSDSYPFCIVHNCAREGKNRIGVRCRVWHNGHPDKSKTAAMFAPESNAYLCDDHALEGANLTLLFEPTNTKETKLSVIVVEPVDERTVPIKQVTRT
jgi:hypothetical protein